MFNKNAEILITGGAGFIGYHVANFYLKKDYRVVIIDNLSNYYSTDLKNKRLKILKKKYNKITFYKTDISKYTSIRKIFKKHKFKLVINLAAQPGVRASIINPKLVFKNNINGFFNILNLVKDFKINHLIYASTSSVYGNCNKHKYNENDINNTPLQMYSASKISNELLAYAYSNIYKLNITGLRFFTVYGPFGRPDMAYYTFTDKILNNQKINIYNHGNHKRDFTYIDDIVKGIYNTSKYMPKYYTKNFQAVSHQVVNLGSGKQFPLKNMISIIEKLLNKKSKSVLLPPQEGDMENTLSNINKAKKIIKYKPAVNLEVGLKKFINWYTKFYNK